MKRTWLNLIPAVAIAAAGMGTLAAVPAPKPMPVITIRDMAFGPVPSGLAVGDQVQFRNDDILRHTATAKAGGFDLVLDPKTQGVVRLTQAGAIVVVCRYHPGMTLTLKVAPRRP